MMKRSDSKKTEDVVIRTFQASMDGKEITVGDDLFTVALNTGIFARAAMVKGFVEHYVRKVDGPEAAAEMLKDAEATIALFDKVVLQAMKRVESQEIGSDEAAPAPAN